MKSQQEKVTAIPSSADTDVLLESSTQRLVTVYFPNPSQERLTAALKNPDGVDPEFADANAVHGNPSIEDLMDREQYYRRLKTSVKEPIFVFVAPSQGSYEVIYDPSSEEEVKGYHVARNLVINPEFRNVYSEYNDLGGKTVSDVLKEHFESGDVKFVRVVQAIADREAYAYEKPLQKVSGAQIPDNLEYFKKLRSVCDEVLNPVEEEEVVL